MDSSISFIPTNSSSTAQKSSRKRKAADSMVFPEPEGVVTRSMAASFGRSRVSKSIPSHKKPKTVPKPKLTFSGPLTPQIWSIPDTISFYFTKKVSSPKLYLKLVKSCKYFFAVKNVLVLDSLFLQHGKWLTKVEQKKKKTKKMHLERTSNAVCKFWVTNLFKISLKGTLTNALALIAPKIYKVNLSEIWWHCQIISYANFLEICSNVEKIGFYHVTVKNVDGSIVPFEELVKCLVKLTELEYHDDPTASSITSNTVKELCQIPHFSKIVQIQMFEISEMFDIEAFVEYYKELKNRFAIRFCNSISQAFKIRLHTVMDKIMQEFRGEEYYYKICKFQLWILLQYLDMP